MTTKYLNLSSTPRWLWVVCVAGSLSWSTSGCSRAATTDPAPTASATGSSALGSSAVGSSAVGSSAPDAARPAGPEELALVAPLVVGSSLADFNVTEINAVRKGVLDVTCRKGRSIIRLWIALASEKGPQPPAMSDKYAVFYSARSAAPADAERLAKALAEIVGKHSDLPVPKGMIEFVPAGVTL